MCIPLCPQTGPPALAVPIPIGVLITTLLCARLTTRSWRPPPLDVAHPQPQGGSDGGQGSQPANQGT